MPPNLTPAMQRLAHLRAETLALVERVSEADASRAPSPNWSPLRWHLGHIAFIENFWGLRGEKPPDERYAILFDPDRYPREKRDDLPPLGEIRAFADAIRARLSERELESYWIDFLYEHESQHQELMTIVLTLLRPDLKSQGPEGRPPREMIRVPAGPFMMGADGPHFAYDNERPRHEIFVGEFWIDATPVTNADIRKFVAAGGPAPRVWGADDEAVTGVGWFEASAYAKFVGKRLPTEAEWEKAAAWDPATGRSRRFPWGDDLPTPEHASFARRHFGPTPVGAFPKGASALGVLDMAGNLWEWTATAFHPYDGFRAHPYEEYSTPFFDGEHYVLKGGSWATQAPLLRASFRNWYPPENRDILAGFRCARS